jgi:flavin reductase (DIM6/NTAB) family NADH-FMN oxidoreductase RutF
VNVPREQVARYRRFAGSFLTGVGVVTSADGGRDFGSTVNSVASLSLSPPLLMVSLSVNSTTLASVRNSGLLCLSFLAASEDGQRAAEAFARPGHPDLTDVDYSRTQSGILTLTASVATAELEFVDEHVVSDHVIVIAAPLWTRVFDGDPLGYWRSGFRQGL